MSAVQQSRNKREGKFIGYAQCGYPKFRDGGTRVVYVRHFFRRPPFDFDELGRPEVHALANSTTLVKIGEMPPLDPASVELFKGIAESKEFTKEAAHAAFAGVTRKK